MPIFQRDAMGGFRHNLENIPAIQTLMISSYSIIVVIAGGMIVSAQIHDRQQAQYENDKYDPGQYFFISLVHLWFIYPLPADGHLLFFYSFYIIIVFLCKAMYKKLDI